MKKYLLLLIALLFITGCATARGVDEHADFDLASQGTIYRDQWVRKSPPEVHVRPAKPMPHAPKVLFMPFRVTQDMENPKLIGYTAGRTVWQTWLSMQIFPMMEFSGDDTPYRRDRAVQMARHRGADLVVGGFVTYLYAGGTAGDTQISLQIEALDVSTGQTIWSIAQAASMPASKKKDYLIFAVKEKLPSDPLFSCTRAIAADTGRLLQNWISGPETREKSIFDPVREVDQSIHDTVFPDRRESTKPRTMDNTDQRSF